MFLKSLIYEINFWSQQLLLFLIIFEFKSYKIIICVQKSAEKLFGFTKKGMI